MKLLCLLPLLLFAACHNPQPTMAAGNTDTIAAQVEKETAYNMNVLQQLIDAGDSIGKPRPVRHWIYFKDTADRHQYQLFAVANKYEIESAGADSLSAGEYPYSLCIVKTGDVQIHTLNAATYQLKQAAIKYHGDYDGWETEIMH